MDHYISVIIPNYNHSLFLNKRIASVLDQHYEDFEVIILDDCSTDDSRTVIESYRHHPKVSHIVYNHENSGSTFKQWEKGLTLAKGSWIWIAESDDYADNNFLEILTSKISMYSNLKIIYSDSSIVNALDEEIGEISWTKDIKPIRDLSADYVREGNSEIKDYFYSKNIIPNASAVLFKSDAVELEWFKELGQMRYAGDWLFWVKLLEKGSIYYVSQKLNKFRTHHQTTRSIKSPALERLRFQEIWSVVSYIKNKNALGWDITKHLWIINAWILSCKHFGNWKIYYEEFPMPYKIVSCLKYLKKKFQRQDD